MIKFLYIILILFFIDFTYATQNSEPGEIIYQKLFEQNKTVIDHNFAYPTSKLPIVTFWKVTMPPKTIGKWHEHNVPELFVITKGTLYVVNKVNNKLIPYKFSKDSGGLTDLKTAQFLWNPGSETVETIAVYLGTEEEAPTKILGGIPDNTILEKLKKEYHIP